MSTKDKLKLDRLNSSTTNGSVEPDTSAMDFNGYASTSGVGLLGKDACISRAKVFLVSIVSFVIAAVIVLLVVLTKVDKKQTYPESGAIDCKFGCFFETNKSLSPEVLEEINSTLANSSTVDKFHENTTLPTITTDTNISLSPEVLAEINSTFAKISTVDSFSEVTSIPMITTDTNESQNGDKPQMCSDVAIIGSGLAGAFAGWRLREQNLLIDIYEMSHKPGGRLCTQWFPDKENGIKLEVGEEYFKPSYDSIFNETITKFGLNVTKYMPGINNEELKFFFRGKHFNTLEADQNPFNIEDKMKKMMPTELQRQILGNLTNTSTLSPDIFKVLDKYGTPVFQQRYGTLLMQPGLLEVYAYLEGTLAMKKFNPEASAALYLEAFTTNGSFHESQEDYYTLDNGMETLPKILLEDFLKKDKFQILYHHRLTHLVKRQENYALTFATNNGTQTSCTKQIILAIPQESLIEIKGFTSLGEKRLKRDLYSVKGVSVTKLFLIYDEIWWKDSWQITRTDLPIEEVKAIGTFIGNFDKKYGALCVTMSAKHTAYWESLKKGEFFEQKSNETLGIQLDVPYKAMVDKVQAFMNVTINTNDKNIPTIPEPHAAFIHEWNGKSSGYLWHAWQPSWNWTEVSSKLIKPMESESVYMIGSSFSKGNLQLWADGALQTVNTMISKYFS